MILLKGEHNSLIIIRRDPKNVSEVIEKLNEIGVGISYGIIDILAIEATIPEYAGIEKIEKKDKIKTKLTQRISLQEIKNKIEEGSKPDFNFFIFIIISGLIAGAGLLLNNAAVIIASMILSPLMGPILGVSFGFITKHRQTIKDGLTGQLFGILLLIGIGVLLGLSSYLIQASPTTTTEMASRNFPSYLDITIAIGSGLAVGFSLTSGITTALVGVAIAIALAPPAVNVGLALIYGNFGLSLGSFLLLLLNVFTINICAIIVFKIKKVTAPPEMMLFWRGPTERMEPEEEKGKGFGKRIKKFFKRGKK